MSALDQELLEGGHGRDKKNEGEIFLIHWLMSGNLLQACLFGLHLPAMPSIVVVSCVGFT